MCIEKIYVVKNRSIYYIYNYTNETSEERVENRWENFGAQFESIAIDLLLVENANIGNWIIQDGKIPLKIAIRYSLPRLYTRGFIE